MAKRHHPLKEEAVIYIFYLSENSWKFPPKGVVFICTAELQKVIGTYGRQKQCKLNGEPEYIFTCIKENDKWEHWETLDLEIAFF